MMRLVDLPLLREGVWHADLWYTGYEYENASVDTALLILQAPPCSGKEPGPEDIKTCKIELLRGVPDTYPTWFHALGDGNPGAMRVTKELMEVLQWADISGEWNFRRKTDPLVFLYANQVIGPELWKLYKDHHEQKIQPILKNIESAMRRRYLPYSPDNYLINTNLPHDQVKRNPLNRGHR